MTSNNLLNQRNQCLAGGFTSMKNRCCNRGCRFKFCIQQLISALLLIVPVALAAASTISDDRFRDLNELLNTPNDYRMASGSPGHAY